MGQNVFFTQWQIPSPTHKKNSLLGIYQEKPSWTLKIYQVSFSGLLGELTAPPAQGLHPYFGPSSLSFSAVWASFRMDPSFSFWNVGISALLYTDLFVAVDIHDCCVCANRWCCVLIIHECCVCKPAVLCLRVCEGGETIRDICRQSGAHVELNRDQSASSLERVFRVTGLPDQMQTAIRLISEKAGIVSHSVIYLRVLQSL